jgi:soluble lytic murein transglycosylase-like protein
MPRRFVSRFIATLGIIVSVSAAPAFAQDVTLNPVKEYASVLRAINPHLADWQRRKYAASVLANAERTRIDPRFIMAIVTVESSWQSNAVSHSGARGLGQLMPATAARLEVNARDAAENLRGTANYLKSLLDRFRGQTLWFEKAIAGYNAGPNAVKRYGGIPPYAETQHYVVKVLRVYRQLYGSIGIAWSPYVSHRRELTRRVVDGPSALSDAAQAGTFDFAPIPQFHSSF